MGSDDCVTRERYVALQAWLCGQMSPRAPHAADLFAQDSECLYDAFLSVLIGTGLGFIDYDDIRFHHGLYAFDFSWATSTRHPGVGERTGRGSPARQGSSPRRSPPRRCATRLSTRGSVTWAGTSTSWHL